MKEIGLLLIALLLTALLYVLGIPYALFTVKNKRRYIRGIAESIDQMGNHVMAPLFNQWMLRTAYVQEGSAMRALIGVAHNGIQVSRLGVGYYQLPYKFGNIDETVSSVLGKNQNLGTLTKSGKWLNRLLSKFDPNHSIDAIEIDP